MRSRRQPALVGLSMAGAVFLAACESNVGNRLPELPVDSGSVIDAGEVDSGVVNAGLDAGSDAGLDAGLDAGPTVDAGPVTVFVEEGVAPVAGALLVFSRPNGTTQATVLTGVNGQATVVVDEYSSVTLARHFDIEGGDKGSTRLFMLGTILDIEVNRSYYFSLPKPADAGSTPHVTVEVSWPAPAPYASYEVQIACGATGDKSRANSAAVDDGGASVTFTDIDPACIAPDAGLHLIVFGESDADTTAAVGLRGNASVTEVGDAGYRVTTTEPVATTAFVASLKGQIPGIETAASTPILIWNALPFMVPYPGSSAEKQLAFGESAGSFVFPLPTTTEPVEVFFPLLLTPSRVFGDMDQDGLTTARHGYGLARRFPPATVDAGVATVDFADLALPSVSRPVVTFEGAPPRVRISWGEDSVADDAGVRPDVRVLGLLWTNSSASRAFNAWVAFGNANRTRPTDLLLPALPPAILAEYVPSPDAEIVVSAAAVLGLPSYDSTTAAFRGFADRFGFRLLEVLRANNVANLIAPGESIVGSIGINVNLPKTLLDAIGGGRQKVAP